MFLIIYVAITTDLRTLCCIYVYTTFIGITECGDCRPGKSCMKGKEADCVVAGTIKL